MRSIACIALLLFVIVPACFAADDNGHWATVNGHRIYYEIRGTGRPLLLLHGGGNTIGGSFANQLEVFAKTHEVIAPEQVGHGHSPDVAGPLSYGGMAEDTAAVLRELHLTDVDVVGWSDGGILALILAARHPELVRRVVASGANFAPGGLPDDDLKSMREKVAESKSKGLLDPKLVAPAEGAERGTIIGAKLDQMWLNSPTSEELSPAILGRIHKRVLVMAGDHDAIRLDHTIELYRDLPEARLCILPGTPHGTFNARPEWVNAIIASFLDEK